MAKDYVEQTVESCLLKGKGFRSPKPYKIKSGKNKGKEVTVRAHCYGSLAKQAAKKAAEAAKMAIRSLPKELCEEAGHIFVTVKKGALAGTDYCREKASKKSKSSKASRKSSSRKASRKSSSRKMSRKACKKSSRHTWVKSHENNGKKIRGYCAKVGKRRSSSRKSSRK